MRLCDLDEIKICVDRQYENCHGYSGSKKAIYREAILAVKSILHSAKSIDGVTVQEWINAEEMLPEFPCLALDVNGNSVFIPDGIITIKDKHGEWCINASLAKEVRLIDGTKIDALIWENRIAYWMPLPKLPKPPKGE